MLSQGTISPVTISPAPLPWVPPDLLAGWRPRDLPGTRGNLGEWHQGVPGRMAPNRALGALELTGGPFFAARSWDLWGDSKAVWENELRHWIGLRSAAGARADWATSHAALVLAIKLA